MSDAEVEIYISAILIFLNDCHSMEKKRIELEAV